MIKFKNVSFTYENSDKKALDNINFEINDGELVLITGASGSGKSTIYKCINGLIPHIYEGNLLGDVFIDDINTKDCKDYELCKKIGSVSQNPRGQFFTDNTTSELAFTLENLGYKVEEILEKIENIIKKVFNKSNPKIVFLYNTLSLFRFVFFVFDLVFLLLFIYSPFSILYVQIHLYL